MKVYLLRHATAEGRHQQVTDRQRRITPAGMEQLGAALRGLRELKVRPDQVLSSPYRRAWDTAAAACRVLNPSKQPVELSALAPGGNVSQIWMELKKLAAVRAVMLVGHEPLLSEFASFLLNSPNLSVNLKKSGLLRIDLATVNVNRPMGTLRWLLTANQMARLG